MRRRLGSVILAASVLTLTSAALAKTADISELVNALQDSDDFRVRTQAALSLGGTMTSRAVEPLCGALVDPNTTVRAAAAAAIGRLHLGGDECLERRRTAEKNTTVKSAIKKALDLLRTEPEPAFTANTRYYVALGKTTDNTGRSGDEVQGIVRKAMLGAAESSKGVLMAPAAETVAQAKKRLAGHKGVKGLYLLPRVGAPQYADRNLKLRIDIAYFTYPGKALLGMVGIPMAAQGVRGKSRDVEDQLIGAASERAIEKVPSFGSDIQ